MRARASVAVVVATVLGVTASCAPVEPQARREPPRRESLSPRAASPELARNVVLVVGDGLGLGMREATRLASHGRTGRLAMERLEHAGWVRTDPGDPRESVTDSAAAATALATGVRTRNRHVGVDRAGRPRPSLLDEARRLGKATGLVTTAEVTDATPAAFGAHVVDRGEHRSIARQYVRTSKPDVVLGGGARRWSEALRERAERDGWDLVTSQRALERTEGPRVLGLFAEARMFTRSRYAPRPSLRDMTVRALEILSDDPDGFFLLVEEEGIDEMAHANRARGAMRATRALDRTVRAIHRFAREHPGTLVVVLGDHDTGGPSIERSDEGGDGPFLVEGTRARFWVDWTTHRHTGAATPLGAEGPGARQVARAEHLSDVHDVVVEVLGG